MTSEFARVVAALDRPQDPSPTRAAPPRVTVLGAGVEGRALAAWLLAERVPNVVLFTVYADELEALASGAVTLRGEGPVGTFSTGEGGIEVTSVLDSAVTQADVVFVTGPVFKLRTYGMVLAPHLGDPEALVVCPGNTFGGIEVEWWLAAGGRPDLPVMVELSQFPFRVETEDGLLNLRRRSGVGAGCRPAHRTGILDWLQGLFTGLIIHPTVLHASFSDGDGLVEVPAMMLGGATMADEVRTSLPGAIPVTPGSFRRLLTSRVVEVAAGLADERRTVAGHYGVRDLPTMEEWVDQVAGGEAPSEIRPVPDPDTAAQLVRQGVLGSLVPLASAARLAGMAVPVTDAMIRLASTMLASDLATAGRRLENMGFAESHPDELRRAMGVGGNRKGRRGP